MPRTASWVVPLGLALSLATSGCALFDADPSRATMAELFAGSYDPEQVTGVDVGTFGLEVDEPATFCEAAATAPLRWTVDAVVPMQMWVDSYAAVTDLPEDVAPSVHHLIDFTERRLRWSLTGEGERPTWDAGTVTSAETLMDVAITNCPDLPLVVGLPGMSERPRGWAHMSDVEVAEHCDSMARRFEDGVAEFEADYGRPPRHQMEMDIPVAFYGTTDFHGIVLDADGEPRVVPVPGGACDLGVVSGASNRERSSAGRVTPADYGPSSISSM